MVRIYTLNIIYTASSRENYGILEHIAEFPATEIRDIGRNLSINEFKLLQRLKFLKDAGLISIDDNCVALTENGKAVIIAISKLMDSVADDSLKQIEDYIDGKENDEEEETGLF